MCNSTNITPYLDNWHVVIVGGSVERCVPVTVPGAHQSRVLPQQLGHPLTETTLGGPQYLLLRGVCESQRAQLRTWHVQPAPISRLEKDVQTRGAAGDMSENRCLKRDVSTKRVNEHVSKQKSIQGVNPYIVYTALGKPASMV